MADKEYVLLADNYTDEEGIAHTRGAKVTLSEERGKYLEGIGAVASPSSEAARAASAATLPPAEANRLAAEDLRRRAGQMMSQAEMLEAAQPVEAQAAPAESAKKPRR